MTSTARVVRAGRREWAGLAVLALPRSLHIGPFEVRTRLLPHSVPNAGIRLVADGRVLAYTGDTGPSPGVVDLARGADLLLAEASYADEVPEDSRSRRRSFLTATSR